MIATVQVEGETNPRVYRSTRFTARELLTRIRQDMETCGIVDYTITTEG